MRRNETKPKPRRKLVEAPGIEPPFSASVDGSVEEGRCALSTEKGKESDAPLEGDGSVDVRGTDRSRSKRSKEETSVMIESRRFEAGWLLREAVELMQQGDELGALERLRAAAEYLRD
jgi:hypothetical protein